MKYDKLISSKHDEGAYNGKMDRLTYSRNISFIIDELLNKKEEYVESSSEKEIVNALIREKNNFISDMVRFIENHGIETINNDYQFNDNDTYKYHVLNEFDRKNACSVEDLLYYHVKDLPFKSFKDIIWNYIQDKSDKENNKLILEFAKRVDELKEYKSEAEMLMIK